MWKSALNISLQNVICKKLKQLFNPAFNVKIFSHTYRTYLQNQWKEGHRGCSP